MTNVTNNLAFPFPLSNGEMGTLYLPPVVSVSDAKRLKRMVNALYINGRKAS